MKFDTTRYITFCCLFAMMFVIFPLTLFVSGIKKTCYKERDKLQQIQQKEIQFYEYKITELKNEFVHEAEKFEQQLFEKDCEIKKLEERINSLELNHTAMYKVKATFYTASPDECGLDYTNTATMTTPTVGRTIAVSRDLFPLLRGKKVYVQGFGVFIVEDTMNPKWNRKCDILVPSKNIARNLGTKDLKIFVLPDDYIPV